MTAYYPVCGSCGSFAVNFDAYEATPGYGNSGTGCQNCNPSLKTDSPRRVAALEALEAAAARANALHPPAVEAEPARVFVLAESTPKALDWCRENSVPARGRGTILVGPGSCRGVMVKPQDRVVVVGDVENHPVWPHLWAMFAPCLTEVGHDVIERVEAST